jgi:hypothetical protein
MSNPNETAKMLILAMVDKMVAEYEAAKGIEVQCGFNCNQATTAAAKQEAEIKQERAWLRVNAIDLTMRTNLLNLKETCKGADNAYAFLQEVRNNLAAQWGF